MRAKSKFSYALAIMLSISVLFNFVPLTVYAVAVPKLTMVTQPAKEYKNGDRVSFTVTSPNYGGKVQYRVILWNGTTKKTSELWNTPKTGYYYTGWMPSGNYKFKISWPVTGMEPGAYSLTVLVRRVGAKVSYDSYTKTSTFWIKNDGSSSNSISINSSTPALKMVTPPLTEYKDGDRISFTVTSPNYSKNVQYRVILWNGTTKKTSELWNTPKTGYYYTQWMPAGNYNFTINWPAASMEPGAYSLTVLVMRVGASVSYDSYIKTNTFWIKASESNDIVWSAPVDNEPITLSNKKVVANGRNYIILKNGSLWGKGDNLEGELGLVAFDKYSYTPKLLNQINFDRDWTDVFAGYNHTFGIKQDGSLWAWGENSCNLLGLKNISNCTYNIIKPTLVSKDNDWAYVSPGRSYTAAIKKDGSLWQWIGNSPGVWAEGTDDLSINPVRVGTDNDWAKVYAGLDAVFALKNDGSLWGWGWIRGCVDNHQITSPVPIGNDKDWVNVKEYVAQKKDGSLWIWGMKAVYTLGTALDDAPVPYKLSDSTDWKDFNWNAGIAIKNDGTLWGIGEKAQITQIGSDDDWDRIAEGYGTSVVKKDDTVWTVDNNNQVIQEASIASLKPLINPKTQWEKSFGGTYNEIGNAVAYTRNEGVITVGTIYSDKKNTNVYVVKTDSNGNKQWEKSYGGAYMDVPYSVQQTKDDGYIIAGTTYNWSSYEANIYLLKLDKYGNKQWEKFWSKNYRTYGYSAQQSSDGGYLAVAGTYDTNTDDVVIEIIKFDAAGNKVWDKYIGKDIEEGLYGKAIIKQTHDGGFAILANTQLFDEVSTEFTNDWCFRENTTYLFKIDFNGNVLWKQSYGNKSFGLSFNENKDGSFIISGLTWEGEVIDGESLLMKTDSKGNLMWKQNVMFDYPVDGNICNDAVETYDGGFILTGIIYNTSGTINNLINKKIYIMKTNGDGILQWGKTYPGNGRAQAYGITKAVGGGYVVTGSTSINDTAQKDLYILKINCN